jgi:hypothetical protein
MKTVTIDGTECYIQFNAYRANFQAVHADLIDAHTGEPYSGITVYIADERWPKDRKDYPVFPFMVVKEYSEGEGMCKNLVLAGVIHSAIMTNGHIIPRVGIAMLTSEWQEEAQKQYNGYIIKPDTHEQG